MNLINVREDEGGGYVYADNNHKRHDGDSHEEDFLETTGNFVFPYHKGRYIVDDCFPTGYHAITAPGSDKTVDDVKVHYWYVTGFHYYYNVNISGYTFKSSKENPLEFDSDNKDGLTVLAGLKSTQPISIFNWKMRSGHPDDKSQYSRTWNIETISQEPRPTKPTRHTIPTRLPEATNYMSAARRATTSQAQPPSTIPTRRRKALPHCCR